MLIMPHPLSRSILFAAAKAVRLFPAQNNWLYVMKQNGSRAFSVDETYEERILFMLPSTSSLFGIAGLKLQPDIPTSQSDRKL